MGFVSLTTDFGAGYTGVCQGVILRIASRARVLVVSDEVAPYQVVEGACLLEQALPYLPEGVHVAVVDPGVGTSRRPIGIATARGDVLVGPDNGLLTLAADALGGAVRAHELAEPAYRLAAVSSSFHGRDIFAPAAAHLVNGAELADFGPAITPLPLDVAPVRRADGALVASVLYLDRYGSAVLTATPDDLPVPFGTPVTVSWGGGTLDLVYAETYGAVPVGVPVLWPDSSGRLGLAVNQGSAAERYGLVAGVELRIVHDTGDRA
ncbi:SAM hydrolase/SAM-dependent halogenase family protein [Actinomadura flavalba]|uniref:SAM hydrolase/SAM-dependent halogenase family protein n=1 Tax=Actinomadura flavalba TaxID=1120938 RepID=UPI00052440B1|nr:SAM-dependent chlorinase/fluorinase [Actinomadura flavalba]